MKKLHIGIIVICLILAIVGLTMDIQPLFSIASTGIVCMVGYYMGLCLKGVAKQDRVTNNTMTAQKLSYFLPAAIASIIIVAMFGVFSNYTSVSAYHFFDIPDDVIIIMLSGAIISVLGLVLIAFRYLQLVNR